MKTKLRPRWLVVAVVLVVVVAAVAMLLFFGKGSPILPIIDPAAHLPFVSDIPEGAQLLGYPIDRGVITAGFNNETYNNKNGYKHYGTDFTSHDAGVADIVSIGNGTVLGTEGCTNSLGNIVVVRYDSVYHPQTGKTQPVIARYYHMLTAVVAKGDTVAANQLIGTIDGSHASYHHVHLEIDLNTELPFNTPQVAENSSALLNRYPITGNTIIEPIDILALDRNQYSYVHPKSDCCEQKDEPRQRKPKQ